MRPSKAEWKKFEQAEELLNSDKPLTHDERLFVFENWQPYMRGSSSASAAGAFFTPWVIAQKVAYSSGSSGRFIDLCAGIGVLSYALACQGWGGRPDWRDIHVTAVEFRTDYVRIGRRLLPEVEWVEGDVFDLALWHQLGRFDHAVSNPPFGRVAVNSRKKEMLKWLSYQGANGLMVAEVALRVAESVVMILPQTHVPPLWRRSYGYRNHEAPPNGEVARFLKAMPPGVEFGGLCEDMAYYQDQWRGVSPTIEVVDLEYEGPGRMTLPPLPKLETPATQLSLF